MRLSFWLNSMFFGLCCLFAADDITHNVIVIIRCIAVDSNASKSNCLFANGNNDEDNFIIYSFSHRTIAISSNKLEFFYFLVDSLNLHILAPERRKTIVLIVLPKAKKRRENSMHLKENGTITRIFVCIVIECHAQAHTMVCEYFCV